MSEKILLYPGTPPLQHLMPRRKALFIFCLILMLIVIGTVVVCYRGADLGVDPGGKSFSESRLPVPDLISVWPHPIPADGAEVMGSVLRTERPEQKRVLNLALTGVISGNNSGDLALISIGGQPAQPYARGAFVTHGHMIHTIGQELVMLAEGLDKPVQLVLSLTTKPVGTVILDASPNVASTVTLVAGYAPIPPANTLSTMPPPRTDSRYRFDSATRHQHSKVEGIP